ncbi:MAG TPA: hypothetical protein VNQ77_04255 [Frankiaceae bacterium]|nr:hypothetical protein [Frankiaceae bacterium]
MRVRPLIMCAVLLGLAAPFGTLPATASAKKICLQITDPEGDGRADGAGALSSPTLDVLSADISTGKTTVNGIIRLKSAAVDPDHVAKLGERWNLVFTVRGVKYAFFARYTGYSQGPTPAWEGGMTVGGTGERANPDATFRREGNNLLWSVSRTVVDGLKKPKTYLFINNAGSGVASFGADGAAPKPGTKYLDRAPSCLAAK